MFLDMLHWQGTRTGLYVDEYGGQFTRNDTQGGVHYWGLRLNCCQGRGSVRALWSATLPAALGGDGSDERAYFNDTMTENTNYWPNWQANVDGPSSTNYRNSITIPDNVGNGTMGGSMGQDMFISNYVFAEAAKAKSLLHSPLSDNWLQSFQKYIEGVCGQQLAGGPPAFYCSDFSFTPALHDGGHNLAGGNVGQYFNGTDASDFGGWAFDTTVLAGGKLRGQPLYTFTNGDAVKLINLAAGQNGPIDQLDAATWYSIAAVDNVAHTYSIVCPTTHLVDATCPAPGAPFTAFTRAGISIAGETGEAFLYHLSYDPHLDYVDPTYTPYLGMIIYGLEVLGYNVTHTLADFLVRTGGIEWDSGQPSQRWDASITVPGSTLP
jgi:hypothetical protein